MINWQKADEIAYRERNREAPNFLSDLETDCFTAIAMLNELRPRDSESWRKRYEQMREDENYARGDKGDYVDHNVQLQWEGFHDALLIVGMVKR